MASTETDDRPSAGWGESFGQPTFVMHDAGVFDDPPEREGYVPHFIGRHGIGPGAYTMWYYVPQRIIAHHRNEEDPCEANTPGCSINHGAEEGHGLIDGTCEPW